MAPGAIALCVVVASAAPPRVAGSGQGVSGGKMGVLGPLRLLDAAAGEPAAVAELALAPAGAAPLPERYSASCGVRGTRADKPTPSHAMSGANAHASGTMTVTAEWRSARTFRRPASINAARVAMLVAVGDENDQMRPFEATELMFRATAMHLVWKIAS